MLKTAILIGLSVIAIFFSTYKLTESPPVWYDEGWYIQTARNVSELGVSGLQIAPNVVESVGPMTTVGYPLIYPMAGWFNVFGYGILQARSLMAIFLIGFLAVSFFLAKRLWGSWVAVGALAFLATLPTLYGNGKGMLGEVPGLLFLVFFLLFFHIATVGTPCKYSWLILSGFALGLCVATKPLFLVLVPVAVVGAVISGRRGYFNMFEIGMAVIAAILPMMAWLIVQFQGSDLLSRVLVYYANPYEISDLGEVVISNLQNMFTDVGALYVTVVMVIWSVAISIRLFRKESLRPEEIMAYLFCLLVIAAFLRTAGWYRYLFPAQAVALIFLPTAMQTVWMNFNIRLKGVVVPTAIALLGLLGLYQLAFDSWVAEAYGNTRTAQWEEYFADSTASTTVFFYNTPEVAIFAPHRGYYQYLTPAGGQIGGLYLMAVTAGIADKVIVESDAYDDLAGSVFGGYILERQLDRYSVLTKRIFGQR